jgi:hypothetical protein
MFPAKRSLHLNNNISWLKCVHYKHTLFHVRLEVLTAVVMSTSGLFRRVIRWRPTDVLKEQIAVSALHLFSRWFLAWLILWPWRWKRHVPTICRLTFKGLHGVTAQKTQLFTCCFSLNIILSMIQNLELAATCPRCKLSTELRIVTCSRSATNNCGFRIWIIG